MHVSEQLKSKSVSCRADAIRSLQVNGGLTDGFTLVGTATQDRSLSVRLIAAAAAADLFCRFRDQLQTEGKNRLISSVIRFDPGQNPGLLVCLAAVPSQEVVQRLFRFLKDPRLMVRLGALACVRRICLSHQRNEACEVLLVKHLASRLSTDVMAGLIRIAGDIGLELPALTSTSKAVNDALSHGRRMKLLRENPAAWFGVWVSEGRDVYEEQGSIVYAVLPVLCADDLLGARLIEAIPVATNTPKRAIQIAGATFWEADLSPASLKELEPVLFQHPKNLKAVANKMADAQGLRALRLRFRYEVAAGSAQAAAATKEELQQVRPATEGEAAWYDASIALAQGDLDEARQRLQDCVGLTKDRSLFFSTDAAALSEALGL